MKRSYFSPITEYTTTIHCGIICGLSGNNNSGEGQQTDPKTGGVGGSEGWG